MSNPSLMDRANDLAFDIITLLIDCGDLTARGTQERLTEWLFLRGITPKRRRVPVRASEVSA